MANSPWEPGRVFTYVSSGGAGVAGGLPLQLSNKLQNEVVFCKYELYFNFFGIFAFNILHYRSIC
jgi:hypothetical protein